MVTNLSGLKNATTFFDVVEFTNTVTNDIMGMMFIIVLFIILFSLYTRRYNFMDSLLVSSFICFGISVMLVAVGLLNFWALIAFGTIIAFTAGISAMSSKT